MKIEKLVGGNLESNGYVIYEKEGGKCFIIDPGYQPDRFLKIVKDKKLNLQGILLTHHHYDHCGGVEKIKNQTGCMVYIHRNDADMFGKPVDVMLEDGMKLFLETENLEVIHTPGHTRGGVCLFNQKRKVVFTGDTIFNVDIGRTDLADGSPMDMLRTMKTIISKWENDVTIYPGHGDSANMKFVKNNNAEYIQAMNM